MDFLTSLTAHITSADILVIFFLIFLEGILSIDNALVLAILARPLLPNNNEKRLPTDSLEQSFLD